MAGSTGERQQEDGIGIVLTTDKDEETVRRERLMEAAAKKQQNIMPLWHLRSTITDDLTALGIKENAQIAANQVAGPSNLDESLKGLGKVVARPSSLNDHISVDEEEEADEDAKQGGTEGNEADCKSKGVQCFAKTHQLPLPFLRLRPVLRVFGSFGRAVDATHAAGRVLRFGRLRGGQEAEHRVSRRSQRAQQAVEVGRERRQGGTETGEGRGRMGSTGRTGEWRAFDEWHGKLGGECGGFANRRPDGLRCVLSLFFLCDAQWTFYFSGWQTNAVLPGW